MKAEQIMKRDRNPFNPQFGRRPTQFVGRDSLINDFIYNIENPNSPHRTTVLTGIRGSGKTAILSDVQTELSAKDYMVVSVTSNEGMLQNIMDVFALRGKGSVVDVERAIKLSKADLFQNVHELLYRELSDKDKEFATAMVEDETKSAFGAIANRMGVTSGYASKYRERLLKSGIIHSSGYGKLAFSPPYMREYLIMRAM